jgi:hypothetical protein
MPCCVTFASAALLEISEIRVKKILYNIKSWLTNPKHALGCDTIISISRLTARLKNHIRARKFQICVTYISSWRFRSFFYNSPT